MLHPVRLDTAKVAATIAYADARTRRNARAGSPQRFGAQRVLTVDRVGAIGEAAVAEWTGIAWPASGDLQSPDGDVGGFEVRSTTRLDGRLILHQSDKPDRAYVLVVVKPMASDGSVTCGIAGQYRPGWGLRDEWWREYRPGGGAFYVPRPNLSDLPGRR